MKNIEVIGGGTVFHVRNHLALCAPAYGTTARLLHKLFGVNEAVRYDYKVNLHLTKMADSGNEYYEPSNLETNEDISKLVDELIAKPETKIIIFNPALVDYEGAIERTYPHLEAKNDKYSDFSTVTPSGKYETRLKTSDGEQSMLLWPSEKIISKIRKERKDIFLVAFKTTCGATEDEQFLTGLHLLKSNSCNLVLANDTKTRVNMIITPEQARYSVTTDRNKALQKLVDMTISRSKGTFTRSKVVTGRGVPWTHELVPSSLRAVVDHCVKAGAYKPFQGSTVGHFAVKVDDSRFLTSMRKTNYNQLEELALVHANGDNEVWSQGGKPSVGGQSQRIVFREHPGMDCIVHFHCPPKPTAKLSVRSQEAHECGSHECGKNTSAGLKEEEAGIKCVYLDNHGPNIVFNRDIDPARVIKFIEENFDLTKSTDGVDRAKATVV